jgi:soluble lytic murein transglycosylase
MSANHRTGMLVAALAASLVSATAADLKLPTVDIPVPTLRPSAYAPEAELAPSEAIRALKEQMNHAVTAADDAELKRGLDTLSSGDIAGALRVRDALPATALDRRILSWAVAINGGDVTSSEIVAAMEDLSGWPGMEVLRRNAERSLYSEKAAPEAVIAALGKARPQTMEGVIVLARAYMAGGDRDAAYAALSPFWRREKLEAKQEALILREFGSLLTAADHRARMEQMLHDDRVNSALRIAGRAGAEELAKAWGAVIRKDKKAARLLDAVPKAQRGAGYIFAKARLLRWSKKYKEAAAAMLQAPTDAGALVDADAWWIERRVLSRELLDLGDAATAYKLAAAHAAESPALAVDAEFHAGWYALRGLRDADTAKRHFQRIVEIAEGPISLSRAHYWLGRAAEEATPDQALTHYERAAQYGTAFYGQLAAARLGKKQIVAAYPAPTPEDRQSFAARPVVQAIKRLEAAGHQQRADLLYRDLAGELASAGELALLAVMAEKRGDHHLALRVGKIAARRGIDIGALSHPVGAIPDSANVSDAGRALAYAIARQESEFNAGAVSSAGARGLLQLLPGTARAMAKRAGLKYSAGRLVTDAGYNASLGAAYLKDQLASFNGSYVLTFAGYNAGPRNAQEWIRRYGDPRGKDIDTIVDWIERIPFTETRNYVQRVMENYQVYKMRLTGRFDIEADLVDGRRS